MHESFIFQAFLEDPSLCDRLIAAHEACNHKWEGSIYVNEELKVDKNYKDSEESFVYGPEGLEYAHALQQVVNDYIAKYPQCNRGERWVFECDPQVQKYNPNGGYFPWHCERSGVKNQTVGARHLVFMTYLNDVTDAGETEFYHQELKVQPRKGLTLIWPADWTHTHRGIPSPTQEKYIVTGWFIYA